MAGHVKVVLSTGDFVHLEIGRQDASVVEIGAGKDLAHEGGGQGAL